MSDFFISSIDSNSHKLQLQIVVYAARSAYLLKKKLVGNVPTLKLRLLKRSIYIDTKFSLNCCESEKNHSTNAQSTITLCDLRWAINRQSNPAVYLHVLEEQHKFGGNVNMQKSFNFSDDL